MKPDKSQTTLTLFSITGIILLCFIVRLPSFFETVYDWDESSMILVAQSIIDGTLPYIECWNNKPPGVFYIYAIFIAFLGKSFEAIRVGGFIILSTSAIILFQTGRKMNNHLAGIIVAILFLVFSSSKMWALGVMPEHIMLLPISAVFFLLLTQKLTSKTVFFTGIILGAEIMIKTNMLFDSIAVLFLLLVIPFSHNNTFEHRLKFSLILSCGICIPTLIFICYYAVHDQLPVFIKTNLLFNIHYVEGTSMREKWIILLKNILKDIRDGHVLLWVSFFAGLLYSIFLARGNRKIWKIVIVGITLFLSQLASIFFTGSTAHYHYLIPLVPVMAIVSGTAFATFMSHPAFHGKQLVVCTFMIILTAGTIFSFLPHIGRQYQEMLTQYKKGAKLNTDSCGKIAEFLAAKNVAGDYIYMVNSCHIVYWLTETFSPSLYAQPSTILERPQTIAFMENREVTSTDIVKDILAKEPKAIVWKKNAWPKPNKEFSERLELEIKTNYVLDEIIDKRYMVYLRKQGNDS